MLHELLMALYGHGGSIFVEKENFKLEVINDIPFFHPSEVTIIRQLLKIGSYYKSIINFCDSHEAVPLIIGTSKNNGQYLAALASSLRGATENYQLSIIKLEHDVLSNPNLPISHLLLALQPHLLTLAALVQLVTQIKDDEVRGCKILETVHKHQMLSVGDTKLVLSRVEQAVHIVLYEQLTHWLLYGLLLDPYEELFVKAEICASSSSSQKTTVPSSSSSTTATSTRSLDTTTVHNIDAMNLSDTDRPKTVREVSLRAEMLPEHIPLDVAEKIIFIGESILVFEGDTKRSQGLLTYTPVVTSHSGLVLKEREEEFLSLLRNLIDSDNFSLEHFSTVIETIRNCVSEHLWSLVLEAGLIDELADVKAVFLLGRGELYQAFIAMATPRLNVAFTSLSHVDGLFKAAGRQVLLDDDILEKFTLSLTPSSQTSTQTNERGLEEFKS